MALIVRRGPVRPRTVFASIWVRYRKMLETGFARKLDSSGRLVIPIKLRERLNLKIGEVLPFLIHEEHNKVYLCIECKNTKTELDEAIAILRKSGYQIIEQSNE